MLGLFNFFGRSSALKALDEAFRAFDLHPALVPEPVKLATIRLMQKTSDADYTLTDADYTKAAELLSYVILGADQFIANTSLGMGEQAEDRLDEAIEAGDSMDAQLVLLAVHSGVIHPTMADLVESEISDAP